MERGSPWWILFIYSFFFFWGDCLGGYVKCLQLPFCSLRFGAGKRCPFIIGKWGEKKIKILWQTVRLCLWKLFPFSSTAYTNCHFLTLYKIAENPGILPQSVFFVFFFSLPLAPRTTAGSCRAGGSSSVGKAAIWWGPSAQHPALPRGQGAAALRPRGLSPSSDGLWEIILRGVSILKQRSIGWMLLSGLRNLLVTS